MKTGNPNANSSLPRPGVLARPRATHALQRAIRSADHRNGITPSATSPASSTVRDVKAPRWIGTE